MLGTDFMYNTAGNLVPIEINTNIGMDGYIPEEYDEVFDLSELSSFITVNSFTKISYIGSLTILNRYLKPFCESLGLEYEFFPLGGNFVIPYIEDTSDHLIIRSAYDSTAIVDEEYCKNKVNFLNLIKSKPFGVQFAYIDENDSLINNITTIIDNGNHPNFILKATHPIYDKDEYPKLYKVTNQTELDAILTNLTIGYHIVPFHYNPSKLYESHLRVIRSFNLLFHPDLNSIPIGQYNRITTKNIDENSTFDMTTFELSNVDKRKYVVDSGKDGLHLPKLLDTDEVEMSDGTFKTALQLQNDDIVKTIIIPNPHEVSLEDDCANFGITYAEFESGTTYSSNRILNKERVDKLTEYVTLTFTDNTTWEDTKNSRYLILKDDNVQFKNLDSDDIKCGLIVGDQLILVDTAYPEFTSVLKEVSSINIERIIFSGWEFTVEERHVFLTRTSGNTSYVAIEHNPATCTNSVPCGQGTCNKNYYCCTMSLDPNAGVCYTCGACSLCCG